jgi:signal transduction histidine kinase
MVPRLFVWLRKHQRLVDTLFMVPLGAVAVIVRGRWIETTSDGLPQQTPYLLNLALAVAMCLPLVWRRRWPRAVFAVIAGAAFVQWLVGANVAVFDLALLVAMYTVAAECAFRWALAALLINELGLVLLVWKLMSQPEPQGTWRELSPDSIALGAIWLCGLYISTRRKYTLSLEERARRLERERDAQAEVAAAAERARIAREMHDVIAHSISVMVIQADGASYAIDTDAARAKRAMRAIGDTGRSALTEMRRMLGVLREGDGKAALAPQPGVDELPHLVEQIRSTGLPVELTIDGAQVPLPGGMELALYRIAQEALTNVMKHAGPSATAWVELHYGDGAVELRIRDDGRGATFSDGRGHGLVSMRERVAVYGGEVTAAPARGGGFEVVARMPVRESPAKQEVGTP